jgi:lysine 2,3-aminomutase
VIQEGKPSPVFDSATAVDRQPYTYQPSLPCPEPDWRRLPGYTSVTKAEWLSSTWQLKNAIRDVHGLRRAFGNHLDDNLATAIDADQRRFATMPILIPPHVANVMDERSLWTDPIRRYMLPAINDRDSLWPSHPHARRDSLHEADMWAVEGLIHRYPYKVLVDLVTTCPQYCGHCTRLDLVGHSTEQIQKHHFTVKASERNEAFVAYIASQPSIRGVVVSGGDIANVPPVQLERFVTRLIGLGHVRDIRLASKALVSLPQHFLRTEVLSSLERLAVKADAAGVDLALHTHVNHANAITATVAQATRALREVGLAQIRNQGVLLRGVNDSPGALLDLCFRLLDNVRITPYYFYMCDIVPNAEHWRISLARAQALQEAIVGYLPGYGTPQVVCDVPRAGKRLVHEAVAYDRLTGVSHWRKSFFTPLDRGGATPEGVFEYYDPLHSLSDDGRRYWTRRYVPDTKVLSSFGVG